MGRFCPQGTHGRHPRTVWLSWGLGCPWLEARHAPSTHGRLPQGMALLQRMVFRECLRWQQGEPLQSQVRVRQDLKLVLWLLSSGRPLCGPLERDGRVHLFTESFFLLH